MTTLLLHLRRYKHLFISFFIFSLLATRTKSKSLSHSSCSWDYIFCTTVKQHKNKFCPASYCVQSNCIPPFFVVMFWLKFRNRVVIHFKIQWSFQIKTKVIAQHTISKPFITKTESDFYGKWWPRFSSNQEHNAYYRYMYKTKVYQIIQIEWKYIYSLFRLFSSDFECFDINGLRQLNCDALIAVVFSRLEMTK